MQNFLPMAQTHFVTPSVLFFSKAHDGTCIRCKIYLWLNAVPWRTAVLVLPAFFYSRYTFSFTGSSQIDLQSNFFCPLVLHSFPWPSPRLLSRPRSLWLNVAPWPTGLCCLFSFHSAGKFDRCSGLHSRLTFSFIGSPQTDLQSSLVCHFCSR